MLIRRLQKWLDTREQTASSNKTIFIGLLGLWFLVLLFFYLFPGIDIAVSQIFYVPSGCGDGAAAGKICGTFPAIWVSWLEVLRSILFYIPIICGITVIYRLILVWSHHGATYNRTLAMRLQAGLISLLLGPLLLTNWIFKEMSHRPRPRNTDLFGGHLPFKPAGDFSGACLSNCSFISGEAAGAGWLFCYTLVLLPARYRMLLMPPLLAVSILSPIMRVAFGGHYLSDVILGWLSSVVIFAGAMYVFACKDEKTCR